MIFFHQSKFKNSSRLYRIVKNSVYWKQRSSTNDLKTQRDISSCHKIFFKLNTLAKKHHNNFLLLVNTIEIIS